MSFNFSLEGKVSQLLKTSSCGEGLKKTRKYIRFSICIFNYFKLPSNYFLVLNGFQLSKEFISYKFSDSCKDGRHSVFILTLLSYFLTLNLLCENRCCLCSLTWNQNQSIFLILSLLIFIKTLKK